MSNQATTAPRDDRVREGTALSAPPSDDEILECASFRDKSAASSAPPRELFFEMICGWDDRDETRGGTNEDNSAVAIVKVGLPCDLHQPNISWNPHGFRGILERMIENDPTFTEAAMFGWCIGPDGVKHIAEALAYNNSLQRLDLSQNELGSDGAKYVAEFLSHNNTLKNLNLGWNELGSDGAKCLVESLTRNNSLQHLDLHKNRLGSKGAKYVAEALAHNSSLQLLDLSYNELGSDGAKDIAEALAHNNSLLRLDLSYNELGSEGAKYGAEALANNNSLKRLDLNDNKLGSDGAKDVAEALAHNNSLRRLDLSHNELGSKGAKDISVALTHNKSLEYLDLTENEMDKRAARPLATALLTNKSLRQLDVDDLSSSSQALLKTMINKRGKQTLLQQSSKNDDIFDENPEQFWVFLRVLRDDALVYPYVRHKINKTFIRRPFLFLTMMDFYIQVVLVATFSSGSVIGIESGEGIKSGHSALLSACVVWLALRELLQVVKADHVDYVTDWWNWLDVAQIVMVSLSFPILISGNPITDQERILITFTVGLVWFLVLKVLKNYFFGIAVFVFAMEQIVLELSSFLIVTAIIISGFVHMNYAANSASSNCSDPNAESFCKLGELYAELYAMFFSEVVVEKIKNSPIATALSYAFGFTIGLLFLNVLIAKISNVFSRVEAKGKDVFWRNRYVLVKEERDVGKFLYTMKCCQIISDGLFSKKNVFTFADDWKRGSISTILWGRMNDVEVLVFNLPRWKNASPMQKVAAFLLRVVFPFLLLFWFALGLFSAGLLWPKWMSSKLFFGPEEADILPNEKQLINIAELSTKVDSQAAEISELDAKVSELTVQVNDKMTALEAKVDTKLTALDAKVDENFAEFRGMLVKLVEQNESRLPSLGND